MTFKEARAEARKMAVSHYAYIGRVKQGEWFASREKPSLHPSDIFFVHGDGRVVNYESFLKCYNIARKQRGYCDTPLFAYHPRNRKPNESKKEWHRDVTILCVLNRRGGRNEH